MSARHARSQKERARIMKETTPLVLQRPLKLCNFVDWKNYKLVRLRVLLLVWFITGWTGSTVALPCA
jgi:AP-1 complex subunit sigma 1/2